MAHKPFYFKQFTIQQAQSAMKVGTDGVLLGAWCPLPKDSIRILDVGTGTGLIALMLAQRQAEAHITALEPDAGAYADAQINATASPWSQRIHVYQTDLQTYVSSATAEQTDLVVSNPPFYTHNHESLDHARAQARSAQALPLNTLLTCAQRILKPQGLLALILPVESEMPLRLWMEKHHWHLHAWTQVQGMLQRPVKRHLWCWSPAPCDAPQIEQLVLEHSRHQRSPEYHALTADFYL